MLSQFSTNGSAYFFGYNKSVDEAVSRKLDTYHCLAYALIFICRTWHNSH